MKPRDRNEGTPPPHNPAQSFRPSEGTGIIDAATLDTKEFPEPRFVIPGILTEGLAFLAGKPKQGKSWLALGVGDAVGRGGQALGGIDVAAGDVLYLALEDTERRLQGRLRAVRQELPPTPRLELVTSWPRLDDGGIDALNYWLDGRPDARLIIIDTWAKVKPRQKGGRNANIYDEDYAALSPLKELADARSLCVLLVHHVRKGDSDDPFEEISGSTGLTGSADTLLLLKRDRGAHDAALWATGRDIEESETALAFDSDTGRWTRLGPADEYRQSEAQQKIWRAVRDADNAPSVKEIAEATNLKLGTVKGTVYRMTKEGKLKNLGGSYLALD
ncbi:AAA family ATPase [Rhodospirillaceae bacterium SYSU D60014]|uniref:AAA family ATPase n=1 Tax=Virgifigura deserti TaxID=2268457 RepID=UPI000E6626F8